MASVIIVGWVMYASALSITFLSEVVVSATLSSTSREYIPRDQPLRPIRRYVR